MRTRFLRGAAAAALLLFGVSGAKAANLMPDFGAVPTGWSTDRYAPNTFTDVGTYQGQSNVLGIGISSNEGYANRSSGYQYGFYSTQGDGHAIVGGAGNSLAAALYVPTSWRNPTQGARRTDMWAVMTDGTANVTDYPIIGFTNYGTGQADLNSNGVTDHFVGFRVWSDQANGGNGGWIDLSATSVKYGGWNSLAIDFTGSEYQFFVNGVDALDYAAASGTTAFSSVLMQAFNFYGDPNSPGAIANDYTAHWANVPEPNSLVVLSAGLLGLGVVVRRRRARPATSKLAL